MTRQSKTPKQRAEEALGIAERRYQRAITIRDRLADDLAAAEGEVSFATGLRAHAKTHPALQQTPSTTNQEAGPTA